MSDPTFAAEQRRIVAKVDELMAVLDALEAALTTARTTSENLLAASIGKLTETYLLCSVVAKISQAITALRSSRPMVAYGAAEGG